MKIAIYGAGAIGSYLGVRLHQAGAEVSLIARGAQLTAMRKNGVTLKAPDGTVTVKPFVTGDAGEAGIQDFVFIALKGYALPGAAPDIARLMGPKTTLITAMNGIPYWYLYGIESPWRGRTLQSVDPDGAIARVLPPDRVIGSVLYPWAEVVEPGVVEQSTSNRFVIGEPDGSESERVRTLAAVMEDGQLDAPVTRDIRTEIWLKLWGNLCFNPLSVLTGATIDRLTSEPGLRGAGNRDDARGRKARERARHPLSLWRREADRDHRDGGGAQDLDLAGFRARETAGDRTAARRGGGTRRAYRPADAALPRRPGPGPGTGPHTPQRPLKAGPFATRLSGIGPLSSPKFRYLCHTTRSIT